MFAVVGGGGKSSDETCILQDMFCAQSLSAAKREKRETGAAQ
jgi:hypothetical protein